MNELEKAAYDYINSDAVEAENMQLAFGDFINGAQWQKEHLWKDAQGSDLPEIDREVIVLRNKSHNIDFPFAGFVSFAHRPNPDGYDGKSYTTGEVEHYDVQTYGKGGWNVPNVVWWLDLPLPYERKENKK